MNILKNAYFLYNKLCKPDLIGLSNALQNNHTCNKFTPLKLHCIQLIKNLATWSKQNQQETHFKAASNTAGLGCFYFLASGRLSRNYFPGRRHQDNLNCQSQHSTVVRHGL